MPHARTIAVALLVAIAPLAVPFSAAAQSEDPTTKAARARFQEGVDFYDKAQFDNARAAFLQAYALKKHPAVLLNLAQSSLRSNRPLEASRYFQQFLRESTNLSAQQRDTANNGLNEARGKLGRVDVAAPPGTEIAVDGERVGTTPLAEAVDVEPGTHVVKARLSDGKEEQQSVTVAAGQRTSTKFAAPAATVLAPVALPAATPPPPTEAPTTAAPTEPPLGASVRPDAPHRGLFAPPRSMAPVWIGLGAGVVGAGVAVTFFILKQQAQDNATSVETEIIKEGGGRGTCASNGPARFSVACKVLAENNAAVNTDATVANIGIAVGAVGLATAVGWYLFAPKEEAAPASGWRSLTPTAYVLPGAGGVGLGGAF